MSINYTSINPDKIPLVSSFKINLTFEEKKLIVEKLLEAHKLAQTNVNMGNITKRGFAANICNNENIWALGTNFNNTRNDISSICAERSAILSLYNLMLKKYISENNNNKFDFKIKYICMANNVSLDRLESSPIPCEDCLSWLNTNRYFDNKTIIFSFDKDNNHSLILKAQCLSEILPFKGFRTSNKLYNNKIEYLNKDIKNIIDEKTVLKLMNINYENYQKINHAKVSNQNIVSSILVNNEIFSANKIDWTKRWFVEPLELAAIKAIEKFGEDIKIDAVAYFGDEFSINNFDKFNDGVVSIKSLGRIRRKYAKGSIPLILNTKEAIIVTTIDNYLPEKFIQGYEIK